MLRRSVSPELILRPYQESQRGAWPRGTAHPQVIVREAQFTFVELQRFRASIDRDVLTAPGVSFIDLDERINRLVIGLDPAGASLAQGMLEGVLKRHDVPRDAVEFDVGTQSIQPPVNVCENSDPNCTPPPSDPCANDGWCENTDPCTIDPGSCGPDPCTTDSASCAPYSYDAALNIDIRDKVRPIVGGIGIVNAPANAMPSWSTLGFSVFYCPPPQGTWGTGGGQCAYYYVITSHQTGIYAEVRGVKFYQPTSAVSDGYIGPEAYDPRWHTTAFALHLDPEWPYLGSSCQKHTSASSLVCRRSDAALVHQQGPGFYFGHLARLRRYSDSGDYGAQQFAIDPNNPYMQIVGEAWAEPGQLVDKIGAATGRRTGVVQRKCVDKPRRGTGYYEPYNVVFRCQTEVQWTRTDNGDSGGPVFRRLTDGTVQLLGVHTAALQTHLGYYASVANIRNDFGIRNDNLVHFQTYGTPPR